MKHLLNGRAVPRIPSNMGGSSMRNNITSDCFSGLLPFPEGRKNKKEDKDA